MYKHLMPEEATKLSAKIATELTATAMRSWEGEKPAKEACEYFEEIFKHVFGLVSLPREVVFTFQDPNAEKTKE